MPRVEAGKGSGEVVETGNVLDEGRQVSPQANARAADKKASTLIPRDYWDDAPMTIVLSGCTWTSAGGNQRPVAMARELNRAGHQVLFSAGAENTPRWAGGTLILPPATLQSEISAVLPIAGTALCTLPTRRNVELCEGLSDNGWTIIYDIVDDWKAFHETGWAGWYQEDLERALMENADAITVSAAALQKRVAEWAGHDATLVPNGGPSRAFSPRREPTEMRRGSEGSVVYCGHLTGTWFHWYMLAQTVVDLPEVEFTIVGNVDGCNLPDMPNLNFVGLKPYHRAMDYVANADVGIIPFQSDELCEAVDPIKWYDYIAGCCRVVASWPLLDIEGRPWTERCPQGALSMAPQITEALQEPPVTRDEATEVLTEADASWASRTRDLMAAADISLS